MENSKNISIQCHDNNTSLEMVKLIIQAVKETHTVVAMAKKKVHDLQLAIDSNEQLYKLQVLQEYIKQYERFINSSTSITGVCVYYNVDVKTIDLNEQLKIMEGLVYLHEALKGTSSFNFRLCLKKLMKESGLFTKKQIDLIDAAMDATEHIRWVNGL